MKLNQKKCKGQSKAINYQGCGELSSYRKYGLCGKCHINFLLQTDEGAEIVKKQSLKSNGATIKQILKNDKKEKKNTLSPSKYLVKYVQPLFNSIILIIDKNIGCICTSRKSGKMNAGHYYSVGKNKTLALNAFNVHKQSEHSNQFLHADIQRYQFGILKMYGGQYYNNMISLRLIEKRKYSLVDLQEIETGLKAFKKELLSMSNIDFDAKKRIELRAKLNTITKF